MSILNLSLRPLPRLLLVAGVVGVIGVTIDLVQGSPAHALPAPGAHGSALAAVHIDHSVVKNMVDDVSLEPGASVAAYDTSIDDSVATAPAPALKDLAVSKVSAPAAKDPTVARVPAPAAQDLTVARVLAPAVKSPIDDDALEPGASVAAYGS
jgi:hypothetical protein